MQANVHNRWGLSIDAFTVAGASKRGWTSWLTAVVDTRVRAIAPMVIDVLNMQAQMEHQRATWGDVSEEIRDYSALDLPARLATERGRELLTIVDPYNYRERLANRSSFSSAPTIDTGRSMRSSCTGVIYPSPSTCFTCPIRVTVCATSTVLSAR